ncbi:MAG: ligase-associated DNA damage response endonuclease PdeM [Hyphomicrobium sp.]
MANLALKPDRYNRGEFNDHSVSICGKLFRADFSGALYWPALKTLIIADLHLEKGSSFARKGMMLPPYDTRETLIRLAEVIDRFGAETIVALGDSWHDVQGTSRISPEDLETLRIMQNNREWIWITGNHDPVLSKNMGGYVCSDLTIEGLVFRHKPSEFQVTHEIAGHLHPAAKVSLFGHTFRRPCFVSNGLRIVLPAFGTYAGGLNILDDAFDPLFGNEGMMVWLLGQEGLYPIAPRLLKKD